MGFPGLEWACGTEVPVDNMAVCVASQQAAVLTHELEAVYL